MRKLKNTRDAILFAAVNCFAEKGFHGTTIREIGAACDVTDPTIYHYFKDKEHLFRQAMDSTYHIFFLILQGALIRTAGLRTELTSYFFAFTEWGKNLRPKPKAYIEASVSHVFEFFHSTPSTMKEEFRNRFHNKFTRLIHETMAHHHLNENIRSLVTFFSTLMYGFSEKVARHNPGAFSFEEIAEAVEQTMQFIFRTQKNIDPSLADYQSAMPIGEIQQTVRKRMEGYPHKIFSFTDFRSYIRYGQPS